MGRRLGRGPRWYRDAIYFDLTARGEEGSGWLSGSHHRVNLFPDDPDARRLHDQNKLLSELLHGCAGRVELPRFPSPGKAVVQAHCQHKAVLGFDAERDVLAATGLEPDVLDSGCCGMVGAFRFERGEHFDVSVRAAERVLLPAVRAVGPDSVVVADGFSCREQIRQGTGRRALHLAEVLGAGLDGKEAR